MPSGIAEVAGSSEARDDEQSSPDVPDAGFAELAGAMIDAPCGYIAFEDDGTVTAVNNTLLRILGYNAEELLGQSVEMLLPVGSRIFYQTHLFPLVRLHGHAEEIFLLMRAKDREDIAFLVNAVRRQKGDRCIIECVLMRVIERLMRNHHTAPVKRQLISSHQMSLTLIRLSVEFSLVHR